MSEDEVETLIPAVEDVPVMYTRLLEALDALLEQGRKMISCADIKSLIDNARIDLRSSAIGQISP
ncbi:MAG TPA: hypothetical protein VFQ70_01450 [Candidatus Saccharimonadaceae bacterium]|nr:hypothetical protein [Candidatus Saccharimonadaceae bacterium]